MIIGINTAVTYPDPFTIGRQRENEVTQVRFDVSEWVRTYGLGTLALSVQRRRDMRPYPVPIAIVDGAATWTISNTDTAQEGHIKAQLTYMVGTKIKKSNVYTLSIKGSLPVDSDAPEAYDTWLEILQTMTAETAANAESARQSATSAVQSASDAEQSMQEAQGHADDASISARNAESSAQSAEENADEAEHYADLAGQHATEAGYAFFDVDDSDGELYVEKTDNLNDLDFTVNETTGTLEVVING